MRWIKRIRIVVFPSLILVQFIPLQRSNPIVVPSQTIYASESVPANVRDIFQRSCKDCHSNETRWPWYSYVAPASWLVTHDIHEARRKMNFSEWGSYSKKKRAHELEEICNEISNGDMPDSIYTLVHRSAKLTGDEREAVCAWTDTPRP